MRAGLRVPHTGQRLPGAQAGHQGAEEGQPAGDAVGQDESADTKDHLSGAEDHVRHAQGMCDIVTNSETELSSARLAGGAGEKTTTTNNTITICNAIGRTTSESGYRLDITSMALWHWMRTASVCVLRLARDLALGLDRALRMSVVRLSDRSGRVRSSGRVLPFFYSALRLECNAWIRLT